MYNSVLVWAAVPFKNSTLLGDTLANYVDAGHTVVLTLNIVSNFTPLRGRLIADSYLPVVFSQQSVTFRLGQRFLLAVAETSPILNEVNNLQGL